MAFPFWMQLTNYFWHFSTQRQLNVVHSVALTLGRFAEAELAFAISPGARFKSRANEWRIKKRSSFVAVLRVGRRRGRAAAAAPYLFL